MNNIIDIIEKNIFSKEDIKNKVITDEAIRRKKIEISELPEINFIDKKNDKKELDSIKESYMIICQDLNNILQILLKSVVNKPLMIYYLLLYVELKLKYYLIINSKLNLELIENYNHDLPRLIETSNQANVTISFSKLRYLLAKFKTLDGNSLNLCQYSNYKYNHIKRSRKLIFNYTVTEVERENIKEVILWLNLHI